MTAWLKCRVSPGMFPREYSVATSTSGGEITMFAPEEFVRPEPGLLKVSVLDRQADRVLILLPAAPFEVSSRTVTVQSGALVT